ncbi:hypothetical protein B9Q06_05290 [Candidatus Marsarchaeota G2 archaeon ECH_B_2]|uniref:Protein PsiE n=3 Tax=Candidatus Marsarchaeota group 2 TaxID=2203771 RepID=A0A2R6BAI4_9ARCH|nr:MAG: hypothetical protein B9Q06_05290 [Candidatus Marsarchaeota G2 archaeon ECH_B_2]PSO00056.1 MAG: hypothetical protein B9Q07_04910 [Candidatus Marsarchaeota G2 archaeon ECH_B_3]PSO02230.1 MAG: hypothetical protein B9Q05_05925 [Candidatus Marsarchaeota G2 archaeon ECH_B_1]
MNAKSISILSQIADVITLILVVVMLVGIVLGIYKTIIDVKQIYYATSFDIGAKNFVVDTLTIFVILELMLGFMQYHGQRRISPLYILDAGLFFVTRELMIELYAGNISPLTLISFGVVIAAVGYTRVLLTQRVETRIND